MPASWLRCRTPLPRPDVRVVCLPHAGGTATSYASWGPGLPEGVELSAIQYPGREDRLAEPPATSLNELVEALAEVLSPLSGRPLVLFGHSFGSLIAFETARRLSAVGVPPAHLVVSGRRAPSLPVTGDRHTRDDDGLVAELDGLGGTQGSLLCDPAFRSVYLPAVRADFTLAETYRYVASEPLSCPVTAAIGTTDTEVDAAQAGRWADHTTGPFALRTFPGGHFYFTPDRKPLLRLLGSVARNTTAPARSLSHESESTA